MPAVKCVFKQYSVNYVSTTVIFKEYSKPCNKNLQICVCIYMSFLNLLIQSDNLKDTVSDNTAQYRKNVA